VEESQDVVSGAETVITVVVATFGDDSWREIAGRAIVSAKDQAPVIHIHGDTLADARNKCVDAVETEYMIHLDADDTLLPGYVNAMLLGSADVRVPKVRSMHNNHREPYNPCVSGHQHLCGPDCLPEGNYIVVGAAVRTELVRAVGGWWPEPIYEDWSLWLRCYRHGATFEHIPEAIYGWHRMPSSRNHTGPAYDYRNQWHHRIRSSILGAA
jgi:Glycosyl transferase family group 2